MSNRFKSIDFIDFYITKLANPVAPIAEGFLSITYVSGLYLGDAPTKIADLLMIPDNTNFYDESDYIYELVAGEGDEDNAELYVAGRELFSSVPIKNFNFRIGARHTTGYVEERNEYKTYITNLNPDMIFEVSTSNVAGAETSDTQFKFPTVVGNSYNITVDWGDGSFDSITTHDQAEATHTYSAPGTYLVGVILNGSTGEIAFNGSGDAVKMTDITQWGGVDIYAGMFDGCSNLTTITATDAPTVGTTMERVFKDCSSLIEVTGMEDWDVSNVTNFTSTFEGATLFNQNLLE